MRTAIGVLGSLAALGVAAAHAQPTGWRVDAACASEVGLRARLGEDIAARVGQLRLSVAELGPAAWEAAVEVGARPPRHLQGRSCAEVVDAAVVVVLLALDADGAPVVAGAVTGFGFEPEPAAPPTSDEPTSLDGQTLEDEGGDPAADDADLPAVAEPTAFVRVGALIDGGVLPGATAGEEVALGLRRGELSARVAGAVLQGLGVETLGRRVHLDLWVVRLLGCRAVGIVRGCAGGELGALGVDAPSLRRSGAGRWAAAAVELGLAAAMTRNLKGFVDLAGLVAVSRPRVGYDDGSPVFRPDPVVVRLALGVEVSIP